MESNKILSADVLDIIFEGRNKEYGAYELRKTYNNRLRNALIGMVALCLLIFLSAFLATKVGNNKGPQMIVQDVQLQNVAQDKKPPPPPPPPPPKPPPPKVEITKFTPPKIVKDVEVKEPPPEQAKLEDTKIGNINQEGVKTDVVAPPVEQGTGVVAPKDDEDYDKVFTSVQVEAAFPGDWAKYLSRNLNPDVATENGAPPGNYTAYVQFVVDKQGNISEVQLDPSKPDPGYGMGQEAVRAIQRGPKWTPALQNGRNVISRKIQPITFQISDQ
jgi:periplasmic protein TonB